MMIIEVNSLSRRKIYKPTKKQMEKKTLERITIIIMDQMRSRSLTLTGNSFFLVVNLRREKNVSNDRMEESAARVLLLCGMGMAPLRENCSRFNLLHQ